MIDTMYLTPAENVAYLAAFKAAMSATNSYPQAKEAGIRAVEAHRERERVMHNQRAAGE